MKSQIIDKPVVVYKGVFKKTASVGEAVFMITSMTIGAGVLGLPYVISQVGLVIGLIYIAVLGLVMLGLNLMIGEIAVRTQESLQLPGLAGKYLGPWAKYAVSLTIIFTLYGVLLAYVVGEGQVLSSLFGGSSLGWSVLFWSVGSVMVWLGMGTIRKAEKVLSLLVMTMIAGVSLYLLPHLKTENFLYYNLKDIVLPYGVILFAMHATPAIVEAHALLPGSERHFKKAVMLGTLIPLVIYLLFVLAVVGADGAGVSEIATVNLGKRFGAGMLLFGNVFAALAMGAAFMSIGISLKHIFVWDYKMNYSASVLLVVLAPLFLFLAGIRSFVAILDLVGGLFVSFTALCIVLTYLQARKRGDLEAKRYSLRHFWLIAVPVLLVFTIATVYYIIGIIR